MKLSFYFLAFIVTVVICLDGLAATVSYGSETGHGVLDWYGNYLSNGSLVELRWAGYDQYIGGGDDLVVDTTSIGFGFRYNGEWWKAGAPVSGDAGMEGSMLYVRVYNASTVAAAAFAVHSDLYEIPSQIPPTPMVIYCNDYNYPIPEPSLFVLVLLSLPLFSRQKIFE